MNTKLIVCCFLAMVALSMAAPEYCALEPEPGLCRGFFPSYYFNPATGTCESFVFGGCGGNENKFETEEDCRVACLE